MPDNMGAVNKGNTCDYHAKLLEEHGELKQKAETAEKRLERMSGRPTWSVAAIIGFLIALATLFATLHFSESSLLYEVIGRQQMVLRQLDDMKIELAAVHEQTTKNAGALDSLSIRIGGKQ